VLQGFRGVSWDRIAAIVIGTLGVIALARGDLALGLLDVTFAVVLWLVENRSEADSLWAQERWWVYVKTGLCLMLLALTVSV